MSIQRKKTKLQRRNSMKKTSFLGKWDAFFTQLSKQELAGTVLPPQLLLCCQAASMATRLAEGIPAAANSLLSGEIEMTEFGDGQAAVRFPLKDGKDIVKFISLLGQGNYGAERLVIKNGIALRLPVSDRQLLRQSLGIPQILAVGPATQLGQETFIWW
jgi:hypothetical protein